MRPRAGSACCTWPVTRTGTTCSRRESDGRHARVRALGRRHGDDKLTPIHGKAAMVTTQAATHAGPWPKASARGFGFTYLVLGDGDAQVAFHRHAATGGGAAAIAQRDSRH